MSYVTNIAYNWFLNNAQLGSAIAGGLQSSVFRTRKICNKGAPQESLSVKGPLPDIAYSEELIELAKVLKNEDERVLRQLLCPLSSKTLHSPQKFSILWDIGSSKKNLRNTSSLFLQSSRGFKTRRQLAEETSGVKFSLGRKKPTKNVFELDKSDMIKGLLNEDVLSQEERNRLKLAFAEGYLAAEKTEDKKGWWLKWLRINAFAGWGLALLLFIVLYRTSQVDITDSLLGSQLGQRNSVNPEEVKVTFEDAKGVDEAKQELQEVVEFLRNPDKFTALGGKLPKGVLLVGPPGTGKTLLARAVAGEAGVPFFYASGGEFDEVLVGLGARRVRQLFKSAKIQAPCVVFIDEIDSVGSKRTSSALHPYANQTINQLLSEMDGFQPNEGVVVLGATNRREDLDKALLRPGRFDVEVQVPKPDLNGRKEILSLYMERTKLGSDVNTETLARETTGFTGADLENLVNQAAVRAALDGAETVGMKHLEFARDKILMGPERKSRIPDKQTNRITAIHECGHTIVAYYTKHSHPLHKVTIIPRGPSLGHTAYIPKEQYHVSRNQLMAILDTLMGGRAAEELFLPTGDITSGASDDLMKATSIAEQMVKQYGMSDKVGLRYFKESSRNALVEVNEVGHFTNDQIDSEVKRLLQDSYERAKKILQTHSKEHQMLSEALLKYETLDIDDIKSILAGSS